MIEVKDIRYRYRGNQEVLGGVSFSLRPGEFLATLGTDGVGKSTLL